MSNLPEVINVDFDRTLTNPQGDEWQPAIHCLPNPEMVEAVRTAYESGSQIIVWTARQWYEAPQIAGWLTANEIPYHGLRCAKGGSELYVDDKSCLPGHFIEMVNE